MKEARRVRCMIRADSCAELPDNRCSEALYPVSSAALSAKGAIEAGARPLGHRKSAELGNLSDVDINS